MTCKDCFYKVVCNTYFNDDYELQKEDCSYFKDKSKIIELPCNVGDTVYRIVAIYNSSYNNKGEWETRKSYSIDVICNITQEKILEIYSLFGKTVFPTREEAVKALAEITER